MSDFVKIAVTIIIGGGLIAFGYFQVRSYLNYRGGDIGNVTPQYGPVIVPRMR